MPKKPNIKHSYTLEGLVADAASTFEELASELGEWRDSLEEKFSQTDKYSRVSEAADTLEGLNQPSLPDWLEKDETKIEWEGRPPKRKQSRSDRRDDACSLLDMAIQHLDERIDKLDEKKELTEEEEGQKSDMEELRSELDDYKAEAEGVEFPGMYG